MNPVRSLARDKVASPEDLGGATSYGMNKSVFIFAILVVFVGIMVWFVMEKTKSLNKDETLASSPSASPVVSTTPAGNVVTLDNGLVIEDVVVGTGKAAKNGDTLNAHYVGKLEDGTKFDSSYDRGQTLEFVLGSGQLIKGWEIGLVGMREGGKRKLTIPSGLGYGARGAGGVIPPNATLFFEIELISVK